MRNPLMLEQSQAALDFGQGSQLADDGMGTPAEKTHVRHENNALSKW